MNAVWEESSKQAKAMIGSMVSGEDSRQQSLVAYESDTTLKELRTIAINVLGAVGYGAETSWHQSSSKVPAGYNLSYMETILTVCENLVPSAIFPANLLALTVMPASVRKIGHATKEFPRHMESLLAVERQSNSTRNNLMSTLVKAADAGNLEDEGNAKVKLYLSEKELIGNAFQFSVAGFETTANTMAYALINLAAYPEWQDWISEELDQEFPANGKCDYGKTYPKLRRVLALMASHEDNSSI